MMFRFEPMNANREPLPCVVCGEPNQTGRCGDLPVCLPCYETGLLAEWLEQLKTKCVEKMDKANHIA